MKSKIRKRKAVIEPPWSDKYGVQHKWVRISEFPSGISAPKKLRLYKRSNHFLLNWWDPSLKKNQSLRIDGDLLDALTKAREIDDRVVNYRRSGVGSGRISHRDLVSRFLEHQRKRAVAGEIAENTCDRYRTALVHYLNYGRQAANPKYATANEIDNEFVVGFSAYLKGIRVSPNGHVNSAKRALKSADFVISIAASMFRWACDRNGGALLGDGFANPFENTRRRTDRVSIDLFGEPDITVGMAAAFLKECDSFQLPIFSLLVFFGLRPSELTFAFRESLTADWLQISCHPELSYFTKGRRDKRLPLIPEIERILPNASWTTGLLFSSRRVAEEKLSPPLLNATKEQLVTEYETLQIKRSSKSRQDRDQLIRDSGGLTYDHIEHEFKKIAGRLDWPAAATLKDFRHLFNTEMQNAGMPEFYRRYLLGQSPGRSSLVNYTHLNDLRHQYEQAVNKTLKPLLTVVSHAVQDR